MFEVVDGLQDVISELQQIKEAVKEKSPLKEFITSLFVIRFVMVVLPLVWGKIWHSKFRYAVQYGVLYSKVQSSDEPHDCEFLAAPLRNKYRDYEPRLSTLHWATSTTGLSIASYDEGKTWSNFTPDLQAIVPKAPTVEEAYVAWQKKEN